MCAARIFFNVVFSGAKRAVFSDEIGSFPGEIRLLHQSVSAILAA